MSGGALIPQTVQGHPRHVLLASVVVGLLLAGAGAPAAITPAGAVLVGVLAAASGLRAPVVLAATLLVIGGAAGAGERIRALEHTDLGPLFGHVVRGPVTLTQAPRPQAFGGWSAPARFRGEPVLLRVSAARAAVAGGAPAGARAATAGGGTDGGSAEAEVRLPPGTPAIGDVVAVRAAVAAPDEYATILRAHAVVRALALRPTGTRRGGLQGVVDGIRRRAEAALARGTDPTRTALLQGMVLGQDAGLPPTVRDEVRAAGLSHLTAASGANVVLLSTLVLAAAALLGVPHHLRWLVVLALIALYVPLAGGGPSIQRAGVMGAAGVIAVLAGRPAARWYALGVAAVVTLVLDPRAATEPGWQLSFVAALALVVLAAPWAQRLQARRIPRPAAEALAVTAAATLATAPVLAAHFDRVAPLSLPANLLVAPVVAPIMWLGFCAAAAGPLVPPVATVLVAPADPLLGWILAVARVTAGVPGGEVAVAGGAVTVLLLAGAALAALGVHLPPRLGPARRLPVAVPAAVLAGVVTAGAWARRPRPPDPPPPVTSFRVTLLDVGQGDATLLQVPGHAVLVDAGPPDGAVVARLRETGVRRLDALVVTHAEADHQGGAAAVLRALPVGLVVDGRDGVRSPLGAAFARAARERGVHLTPATAGTVLTAGPLTLRVLGPPLGPTTGETGGDPNARAVVAEATAGGARVLLPADAESEVLARLELRRADVLKVPHHGSADRGLPALLERVRPLVAGIEVGAGNTYGHPAPPTLAALAAAVPRTVRTDEDGTVRLDLVAPGRWTVTPGRAPPSTARASPAATG